MPTSLRLAALVAPLLGSACTRDIDTGPATLCHETVNDIPVDDASLGFTANELSVALHAATSPTRIVWDDEQVSTLSLDIGPATTAAVVTRTALVPHDECAPGPQLRARFPAVGRIDGATNVSGELILDADSADALEAAIDATFDATLGQPLSELATEQLQESEGPRARVESAAFVATGSWQMAWVSVSVDCELDGADCGVHVVRRGEWLDGP